MADTEFVWTVVPGGSDPEDGDIVLLNVHVGIKLTADGGEGTLEDHRQFFDESGNVTWPPDPELTFDVEVDDGGSSTTINGVPLHLPTYDRAYWADVFSATTRVTDFVQRDLSAKAIHTHPAAKIAQAIQGLYAQAFPLGQNGLPTGPGLLAAGLADLSFRGRTGAENRRAASDRLDLDLASSGVVDTTASSDPTFDFFQLLDYYAPQDLSAFQDADENPIPSATPTFSFNEALVGLHAEPTLQRLFGLVLPLRLSRDEHLSAFSSGQLGLRARPVSRQLAGATHRSPRTLTSYSNDFGGAFAPLPRPTATLIADGYLRMDDAGLFSVSPVDPNDGLKVSTAAGNVEVNQTLPDVTKPVGEALPALRSGLFVSMNGAAKDLKDKFAATPPSTAALDTTDLYAEDLMKGFLVDIRHEGIWRSEAFRSATYTFPTAALDVTVGDEEGHSSRGVTGHLDGNPDLYAGEVIYAWEGFPTGLPMPGRALNRDPADPQQAVDPEVNPDGAPTGDLPYTITHGLPATNRFSRLLCGEDYAFRARVRWLDGTNVAPREGDDSHATSPLTYRRTEPVPPCDLYPTEVYVPGEGQSVVVLRGNYDTPPEKPFVERLVLPKRTAFPEVLKTRLFDVADPGDPNRRVIDRTRYTLLAARDAYRLGEDPAVSAMPEQPDQVMVDPATFVTSPLPYLPDPMVTGVALHLLDGPQPGTTPAVMQGGFPDPVPLWFRLEEGSGAPSLAGDRIVVPLRKGDKVRAAHSALLDDGLSGWLAVLQWAEDAGLVTQDLRDAVAEGRHTAITPWADLTFVYAVRQPLAVATFGEPLRLLRPKGATWVEVEAPMPFSRRSTDQIDVTATWQEYIDDGPDTDPPTSATIPPLTVAKDAAITINVDHAPGLPDEVHQLGSGGTANRIQFGDTRHRDVDLGTLVTSRYAEHFTQRHVASHAPTGQTIALPGAGSDGLVPGWVTIRVPLPVPSTPPANPADRVERLVQARPRDQMQEDLSAPFDPTAYHPGHFRVHAADGEVEMLPDGTFPDLFEIEPGADLRITYLLPPVTRRWPDEAQGQDPRQVNVLSSARPAAPVVRYVIPTFGWATAGSGGHVTSMRDGRGLRIYLERPWWSSGGGELLGVLLWAAAEGDGNPAADMSQEHPLFPYVTQWGEDPLFDAGSLPTRYPRTTDFTNRVAQSSALRVDGTHDAFPTADQLVVAVGHEVTYDLQRDLWFTDVVLEAGAAYTPFIRLALVRFQPDSIGGCHLSPVVLAEFVQLAPDRSATVIVDPADASLLTVTLTGAGPNEGGEFSFPRGRVQVTVEERRPNPGLYADEELTWTPVAHPVLLAPVTPRSANTASTFSGPVQLPASTAAKEWRIVIEEFETHAIEPLDAGHAPGLGGRLVHTDAIVVTAGGPGGGGGGGGGGVPGPAPIFDDPSDEEEVPPIGEIYEVAIDRIPEIGPGPVITRIQTSLGEVVIELLQVTGQGTLRLEVLASGDMQAPAGVSVHNVIDISTSGLAHEGANLTVPRGADPTARNGLGMRLFHGGGGQMQDITTGLQDGGITGFAATLSPFATGEYSGLQRLAGPDRVATAVAISAATFAAEVPRVYLATAGAFPDALTAGPRAAREGAPILLVGDTLPGATAAEIERLAPPEAVLLGGEAAISAAVADAIRARFPALALRRIAGADRFDTAAAISAEAFPDGADVVYVATGGSFPDALGGGTAAARDRGPLLLVGADSVPEATESELTRLAPSVIRVLGGTAVVSEPVAARLGALTGADVQRLAGPDRYGTAAAIAATFDSPRTVMVATGDAFPDALAGVPASGADGAALVLVRPTDIPEPSREQIQRLAPDRIVVLGGDAAVREALELQLAGFLLH